jgi:hypothetical protein
MGMAVILFSHIFRAIIVFGGFFAFAYILSIVSLCNATTL